MAMLLTIVVLCATVCLSSNVPRFRFVPGSTFLKKSAKDEILRPVHINGRSPPETYSINKFVNSKPEQRDKTLYVSDNNPHTIDKNNKEADLDKLGKDNQREEVVGKVSRVSSNQISSSSRSGTNVTNNDTSAEFSSGSNVHNKLPKINVNLNIFKFKRDRDILDKHDGDETEQFSRPLMYSTPRSDRVNNENDHPGFEMTSVTWIPLIGHNKFQKLTSKSHEDYDNDVCSCNVNRCNCSSRVLTKIPQNLPAAITELLLNDNSLHTLLNDVLSRYQMLENLILSFNHIMRITDGAFNGLTRLISLDLSTNGMGLSHHISERAFEPLKSLKRLLLEANYFVCFTKLPPYVYALAYLYSLEELKIDYFGENSFGPEYNKMTSLRKLSVYCLKCFMNRFSNYMFQNLSHITSLDISACSIKGSAITSDTFSHFINLQTLDISTNPGIGIKYLPTILRSLRNSSLQTLDMSYIVNDYDITRVDSSLVRFMPQNLTTLVSKGNKILTIDSDAVRILPKSLKVIDLNENNIIEDPTSLPLKEMVGLETLFIHGGIDDCMNSKEEDIVQSLCDDIDDQKPIESEYIQLLDNGTLEQKGEAKTILPGRLKSVKINFQSKYYDFLELISEKNNIKALDLSCSYIFDFFFSSLSPFQNLRCLNLRKSSIKYLFTSIADMAAMRVLILESNMFNDFLTLHGFSFSFMVNLVYLDLSLNQLSFVHQDLLRGLNKLEYVRLDRNLFSVFDADISNMTELKLLNLSNTELSQLSSEVRTHIDQLCKVKKGQIRVDMSGCPIQCDCFNLDFLKWMVNSPAFDKNFTGYKCKYPDTSLKYIKDGYQETIHVLDRECAKNYPLFLIVLAATSLFMFTVVGAVVYRFRWKIRYLYYAAYLKVTKEHKMINQHEFAHDVFISYDSEDRIFVCQHLSPELEKRGLKLLIHSRDFVAGTYIAANIVMAVGQSRKTLVVLTRNLLESSWCDYELQMANMEAVHTGRQVLVFLLKENISNKELDLDLLSYIRSNTYLPYPDPEETEDADVMKRFYDKLTHDLKS